MKSYARVGMGLILLSVASSSHAQQGKTPISCPTRQPDRGLWQELINPSAPDGLKISVGPHSYTDWVAASYESNSQYQSGTLYMREGGLKGVNLVYDIDEDRGGSGYLFDPVMTQNKVFFRYGKTENPIDGYNLLYIDKDDQSTLLHWVTPKSLNYNRVEIAPSNRYVAYMTSGGYYGANDFWHRDTMTLWVTDIQANKIARVDVGDWIVGTYWWDGDMLRFLNLTAHPAPLKATLPSTAGIQKSVPTRKFIESKQFDPNTGTTQVLGRQIHRKTRFYLENYYNAFFSESYTKAPPKRYADVPQSLHESVLFNSHRHELLFASRVSPVKAETQPNGRAYYLSTFAIVSMTGSNKFTPLADFTVRSFELNPEIKPFRVGKRIFAGVKSYSPVPNTYAPQIGFPSCIMTIYEIKNGKAEVIRQEENCFGLSQLIDGTSVFVTY